MKELITTQLIEEYQKELKTKKTDFFVARNGTCLRITLAKEIFNIENSFTPFNPNNPKNGRI
jgi:hypothetical protein